MRAALVLLACASPFALHLAMVSERRAAMIAVFPPLAVGALAARMPAWVTAAVALAGIGPAWIDLAVNAQLALAGPMHAFLAGAWQANYIILANLSIGLPKWPFRVWDLTGKS